MSTFFKSFRRSPLGGTQRSPSSQCAHERLSSADRRADNDKLTDDSKASTASHAKRLLTHVEPYRDCSDTFRRWHTELSHLAASKHPFTAVKSCSSALQALQDSKLTRHGRQRANAFTSYKTFDKNGRTADKVDETVTEFDLDVSQTLRHLQSSDSWGATEGALRRITEDLGRRFKHERDRTFGKHERDRTFGKHERDSTSDKYGRDTTSDKHESDRTSDQYDGDKVSHWDTLTLCGDDVKDERA